ncbi:uncharacterized protein LOC128204869 [Mya arenaria]|uniref:uncharacterized protein LOC128204869 n=1 Tax=Mya arenaria TaxID=6604 RepID=UPI0022E7162B|nr:uncharacterized protein LOC128204869 [Mya arenaria]
MEMLWFIIYAVTFGAVYSEREPACSRFHYEEKLLEKMVRSEFKMDAIDENFKTVTDSIEKRFQTISDIAGKLEDLKKEIETLKTVDVETLKTVEIIRTADVAGSSIYTRWGRRSCPGDTELVYEGFAGGGYYSNKGASNNYICLPKDPVFDVDGRNAGTVNLIYGAEYETSHSNLQEHDVPCAVCRVVGKSIVMIPARKVCYSGWHTEYSGYLMSSYEGHTGNKDVVCMDGSPEAAEGTNSGSQDGALFYFVQIGCGALKCPPYRTDVDLTCVVCSK